MPDLSAPWLSTRATTKCEVSCTSMAKNQAAEHLPDSISEATLGYSIDQINTHGSRCRVWPPTKATVSTIYPGASIKLHTPTVYCWPARQPQAGGQRV